MKILEFLREYWELKEHHNRCKNCEILESQLAQVNNEKTRLLQQIIELSKPTPIQVPVYAETKPAPVSGKVSWGIRRQMMEAEDRVKASLLRKKVEEARAEGTQ